VGAARELLHERSTAALGTDVLEAEPQSQVYKARAEYKQGVATDNKLPVKGCYYTGAFTANVS